MTTVHDELLKVATPAPSFSDAPQRFVTPSDTLEYIEPWKLHPDPENPRKTVRNIEELADSLREVGMLQPIVARYEGNKRMIIMGQRRWEAAKRIGMEFVPVIMRQNVNRIEILRVQLVENSQRVAVDVVEEAEALRKYMRESRLMSHELAAKSLGRSMQWIASRLSLLDLDSKDQEDVRSGHLTLQKATKKAREVTGRTRASRIEVREIPSAAYFGHSHELSSKARKYCVQQHVKVLKIAGNVACGPCWEHVIREDALASVTA